MSLSLPSFRYVARHAGTAFRRFPTVILSALLSAVLYILMVETNLNDPWFTRLAMTCTLGIPLFFSLRLYDENPAEAFNPGSAALLAAGLLFLGCFYALSGGALTKVFYLRYVQWALVLHLFAAFAPFPGKGRTNGFWQYNRGLFLRFCSSFLYAAVFHFGLALALWSLNALLGLNVHQKLYADLWLVSVFVLQTWYFLAGVPEDVAALEEDASYPPGLKVFTQYMLIPLVALYTAILYVYMGKILLARTWPKGMVTGLVSGLAVFGLFTLLLVHPVQEREENRWIKAYARAFSLSLFPLLALLLVAVGKRIGPYGVTEERYFVVALALWICGVAAHFARGGRNIKLVPVSLCLLALAVSFGPWGAYGVSRRSQQSRLKAMLSKDGMWEGKKARKAASAPSFEDERQISSILDYLLENHGPAAIEGWFDTDLSDLKSGGRLPSYQVSTASEKICRSLGIAYRNRWESQSHDEYFSFYAYRPSPPLDIRGYDVFIPSVGLNASTFEIEGATWTCRMRDGWWEAAPAGDEPLRFDAAGLAFRLEASRPAPQSLSLDQLALEADGPRWAGRLYLQALSGSWNKERTDLTNGNGVLFLRKKERPNPPSPGGAAGR